MVLLIGLSSWRRDFSESWLDYPGPAIYFLTPARCLLWVELELPGSNLNFAGPVEISYRSGKNFSMMGKVFYTISDQIFQGVAKSFLLHR